MSLAYKIGRLARVPSLLFRPASWRHDGVARRMMLAALLPAIPEVAAFVVFNGSRFSSLLSGKMPQPEIKLNPLDLPPDPCSIVYRGPCMPDAQWNLLHPYMFPDDMAFGLGFLLIIALIAAYRRVGDGSIVEGFRRHLQAGAVLLFASCFAILAMPR